MNGKFNNNNRNSDGRRFGGGSGNGGGFGGNRRSGGGSGFGGGFGSRPPRPSYDVSMEKFKVGDTFMGAEVKTVIPVGVFIALDDTKDGFLHVSGLANERVENINDYVSVGQKFDVRITEISFVHGKGRIRLENLNLNKDS